jgi:predicted Ser/Thr protein kinase
VHAAPLIFFRKPISRQRKKVCNLAPPRPQEAGAMNTPTCPNCRNPIPADAPGGICPSCALLGVAQPTVIVPPAGFASRDEVAAAFPDLEVLEMIGQGGMGVVFKARQPRLDRLVALKILPPHLAAQPGFAERFTREARALAKLNHPHIVTVYDFGESGGFYYLLMEFVDGVNLRKAMQAGVKPEQAMLLVPRICEALQFAHDHGVLHRDIKPENILLDLKGTPKLADFGIAKLAGDPASGLTLSGAQLGTASYMAPEQIEKPATVDHRADIYSLGVVFYEMLTGELPLGRFAAPSEKAAVGESVDAVVLRALEKERERRQQSAGEMKTQVEGASSGMAMPPASANREEEAGTEGGMKHFFHVLTVLAGVGIPASAVVPGMKSLGLTPAVMVFVCAAFAVLSSMWPARPRRRPQPIHSPGRTHGKSESRSARSLFGYPLWHIVHGPDPKTGEQRVARGILAIGPEARGFVAIGGRAHGVLAMGGLATGVIALGGLAGGLLTAGGLSLGLLAATGGLACGGLARGGVAIGYNAAGGFAIGHVANGGKIITDAPGPPDVLALQVTEFLITAAQALGVAALLAGLVVWQLAMFSTSTARSAQDESRRTGHHPSRRFLIFSLVLLALGAGVFIWRKIEDAIGRKQTPDIYELTRVARWVDSKKHPFATSWDHGSAELVAVSQHPSRNGSWWQMNGQYGAEGPFLWRGGSIPGPHAFEFVFRLRDLPADASPVQWRVEHALNTSGGSPPESAETPGALYPSHAAIAASFRPGQKSANIKLGVAGGEWTTLASLTPDDFNAFSVNHEGRQWSVKPVVTKNGRPDGQYMSTVHPDWQLRMTAVNAAGEDLAARWAHPEGSITFPQDLKLADVKMFRFQVRAYQWIEFRGIALEPEQ